MTKPAANPSLVPEKDTSSSLEGDTSPDGDASPISQDDDAGRAFSGNRDGHQNGEESTNGRPPGQAGSPGDPRPN